MKVMDFVYRLFGFEGDDVQVVKKKNKTKASYNLKIAEKLPDEIDDVKVFYPESLEDAKQKVELLKKNTPFFMDYRFCNATERNKILEYFHGVIDVLGATEENVDKNLYIYLPKNMELERGEK